jgi:Fe-S-cluster containining protein
VQGYDVASSHMSIVRRVKQVQKVFELLEKEMSVFQQKSGLGCLKGCGHCCTKPDISAAVLEFLPYAFDLFLQKRSSIVKEQLQNNPQSICHIFKASGVGELGNTKGGCTQYHNRGLICRLFGFATVRDKVGNPELSTCKWIKRTQAEEIEQSKNLIAEGVAPSFMFYYQELMQIDFRMGQEYLPINEAIIKAIDEVENYYQYRPFPYSFRKSA